MHLAFKKLKIKAFIIKSLTTKMLTFNKLLLSLYMMCVNLLKAPSQLFSIIMISFLLVDKGRLWLLKSLSPGMAYLSKSKLSLKVHLAVMIGK